MKRRQDEPEDNEHSERLAEMKREIAIQMWCEAGVGTEPSSVCDDAALLADEMDGRGWLGKHD